ncbi:MAG: hypothetical protein JXA25_02585, partial [Anaerolineales bacterium]|nr:hypothetical protein [Anaerolineales bacterium]
SGDGALFDGTGIGRAWLLLKGERVYFELAARRRQLAVEILHAMEQSASEEGILPEQVWDALDFPEKEFYFGDFPVLPCRWSGLFRSISNCFGR